MIDEEALLRMVTGQRIMLQAYIRALIRDTHLVEDVLQDVVVVAIKQRAQFVEGSDLGAWLRAIARRTALATLRKSGQQALLSPETLDALEITLSNSHRESWDEERDALRACLKELPEASSQLLTFRYEHQYSTEQISKKTGKSVDAIKSLLKRLRIILADCVSAKLQAAEHPRGVQS